MKKLTIGLSLAAMAFAGAAYAQQGMHPKFDTDGDGALSSAEAQAMSTQMFARMDANNDGKLDEADREARRGQMFDRIDSDKNGQISREEFMAKHERGPRAGADGTMGDGGHGRMRGHGGHGMMMMRMADTDKDGAVSQAEFAAASLKHFEMADANKDGKVTKEERQAARATMHEMRHDRMGDRGAPPPAE